MSQKEHILALLNSQKKKVNPDLLKKANKAFDPELYKDVLMKGEELYPKSQRTKLIYSTGKTFVVQGFLSLPEFSDVQRTSMTADQNDRGIDMVKYASSYLDKKLTGAITTGTEEGDTWNWTVRYQTETVAFEGWINNEFVSFVFSAEECL